MVNENLQNTSETFCLTGVIDRNRSSVPNKGQTSNTVNAPPPCHVKTDGMIREAIRGWEKSSSVLRGYFNTRPLVGGDWTSTLGK